MPCVVIEDGDLVRAGKTMAMLDSGGGSGPAGPAFGDRLDMNRVGA